MDIQEARRRYDKTFANMDTNTLNEIQSLLVSAQKDLATAENEVILNKIELNNIEDEGEIFLDNIDVEKVYDEDYGEDITGLDAVHRTELQNEGYSIINRYYQANADIAELNQKVIPYLKERIAYFTQLLLEETKKYNPHFIPNKYKLESEDFNKIAHFRVLPVFNEQINSYVQDNVILGYKRKLIESAIDSRESFRFTMLPLFIQNISYGSNERTNMLPLIGDVYDSYHYGRSPQILSISGVLLDTPETNASAVITMLYMDFFRLAHVSRIGVPLTLEIGDKLFTGAFISLNTNKTTEGISDLLNIDFEFLVLEYFAYSQYNRLDIKNTHNVIW